MFDDMALYMTLLNDASRDGAVHRLKADWGAFYFYNPQEVSGTALKH